MHSIFNVGGYSSSRAASRADSVCVPCRVFSWVVSSHCAVGVSLGAVHRLYCSPLPIANYYPLLAYATVQHHSLADNNSNSSRSACTPRQVAASIVSRIVAWADAPHPPPSAYPYRQVSLRVSYCRMVILCPTLY